MESKSFFFPPIIDTKIDQPQAEIVIDHDKVAAMGLNLQQIGADLSRPSAATSLTVSTSRAAATR
jgi:multidrug efflux pump